MASTVGSRSRVAHSLVLTLAASTLVVLTGLVPASAAENPPSFIATWGNQGTGNGQFRQPYDVAVGPDGSVYVADLLNQRIQRFTSTGTFVTTWGSFGTGNGQFHDPYGVAVDNDGYVYVADEYNHRIQKFTSNGTFVTKWGSNGTANGQFQGPVGVAVDDDGFVYVADNYNHRIQKFTSNGTFVTKWGSNGTANGQFDRAYGLAVDSNGYVFVADYGNHRIQKFTSTGTFVTKWGSLGSGNGQFNIPVRVAVDDHGAVYVADTNNYRVEKFTSTGTYLSQWGSPGNGDGEFGGAYGLAAGATGEVYVADTANDRIQVFGDLTDPTVTISTPPDGATFARNAAVVADYSCSDEPGGSGIDTCTGTVADGSPISTSTLGDHDFTVTATDNAGNTTETTQTYTVEDVTDPTVDLRTPLDGAVYTRNEPVPADYSCSDEVGGSGIDSCEGTVADGAAIDTSTLGDHDFTVTAADVAGNSADVTHTFTVVDPQPDGRIKKGRTGIYVGEDVYNTTGTGQTRTGSVARGGTVTYLVSVQNDAPFSDALRVKGTASNSRFRVTYSVAGFDVTTAVTGGTYTTAPLAPGQAVVVRVDVKVKGTAPVGSSLNATLTTRSTTDPAIKDTVRFITSRR